MPIEKIEQPQIIEIDDTLRLRKYDGKFDFAFEWYQDTETVYLVDGVKEPYSFGKLRGMYEYLNEHGELYFIEAGENGNYKPIGDVTFWQNDMPIVIGDKNYRGKHIGRKVILALIERGKSSATKSFTLTKFTIITSLQENVLRVRTFAHMKGRKRETASYLKLINYEPPLFPTCNYG